MAVATSASFVAVLKQYHLLEAEQLAQVDGLAKSFADAKSLAGELIKRSWLTAYQVNQIFQGKVQELLLENYVILERIGEGGMGAVFKARQTYLNRLVAIKVIRKERVQNQDAVRRFHREVRAAAALNHPNIVRAYDAGEAKGVHFMVMEYVEGNDLSKLVKEKGPLPFEVACAYIRQAALGLQHAHEKGMVHRDIKPSNLLLQKPPPGQTGIGPVVKILDLGLARIEHGSTDEHFSTLTETGAVMGTPSFMAPEQALSSKRVDIRADIYSLGCTFYYLLTGKAPFHGETIMELLLKHREVEADTVVHLPAPLQAVLRKMLAKKPEDRYQTPGEVAADLTPYAIYPQGAPPVEVVPVRDAARHAWQ